MRRITRAAQALGFSRIQISGRRLRFLLAVITASMLLPTGSALATGSFTTASAALSDPTPSTTSVTYTFTGSSVDGAQSVECVQLIWSTGPGNTQAPTGFSGVSGSVLATSSSLINSSSSGWSLAKTDGTGSSGQNNIYSYTSSTGATPSTTSGATFVTQGLTNPSSTGSYYLSIATYGSTDCSTGLINSAVTVFVISSGPTLSMTVNPTLSFTIAGVSSGTPCDATTSTVTTTGTAIPLGNVTPASNSIACQQLTAATNATNGYTVYLRYSGALNNGSNNFADISGSNSSPAAFPSPGTEAYGYTTDASALSTCGGSCSANRFTSPSQGWAAATTTNAEVAYSAGGDSGTSYMIGHQAGIATDTPFGDYTTTIIYTCTPTY